MNRYLKYFRNTGISLLSFGTICLVAVLFTATAQHNDGFGPEDLAVTSPAIASSGIADSLDTFDRANDSDITGNTMSDGVGVWEGVSGRTGCNVTDNECSSDGTDRMNSVTEASRNYNDNQWASVKVGTSGAAGYLGVLLRCVSGTGAAYVCIVNGSTTQLAIYEAPSMTQIDTSAVTALVAGDVIRWEVSGGDFTIKINGSQVDTFTDGSALSGGQPGVYSNSFFDVDDFRCGNL